MAEIMSVLQDSTHADLCNGHHTFGAPPQLKGTKELFLSSFGFLFFDHLLGEYESFTNREIRDPEAYQRVGLLKEAYLSDPKKMTWGDLATLECLLLKLRTDLELRERFLYIELRYKEVASPSAYSGHAQLKKSEIDKLQGDELRAQIEVFACEFFRVCVLAQCREAMRDRASRHVSFSMLTFVFLYVVFNTFRLASPIQIHHFKLDLVPWALPGVLFAGAMGGFVSSQRRIQGITHHGESVVDLISLSHCLSWLAPISGAIFAVILYAMFAAKVLTSNAFPEITIDCPNPCVGVFSALFSTKSGPADGIEAAKLAVWCFAAGFAERFVPNALDRLVATAEERKKSETTSRIGHDT